LLDPLEAISPLDGRYRDALSACSRYFSEHALIRYRLYVEVRYLRAFAKAVGLGVDLRGLEGLEEAVLNLSLEEAAEVKHVEARGLDTTLWRPLSIWAGLLRRGAWPHSNPTYTSP
jgi:adenylosuccinate lyase